MKVSGASNILGFGAILAAPAAAFWRMPCPSRLVMERIDPIVSPGQVASHVHTVSGASGFGFETSYEQLRESACTSCPVRQDLSVYWTPNLYFMAKNGSYISVPQAGEGNGVTGGMTVYYEQRGVGPIEPFPPGLRMLAGTPEQRNDTGLQAAPGQAVSFVCLNYGGGGPPQAGSLPVVNCPQGVRAQIYFPSCWDGIHNDTADHKSHMAYPIGSYDNGRCPDSHPHQLISIFYEVIYQTNLFDSEWDKDGKTQPFVFSMGDRTGYGFHGDFINGWDTDALRDAINTCTNLSGKLEDCGVFMKAPGLFPDEECHACMLPPSVDEQVEGVLDKLPGCNEPTSGPEMAAKIPCASTPIGQPATYFTDVTQTLDWKYAGCAGDNVGQRTLQADFTWSNDMTVKLCVEYCKGKGYSLAGLEFANQCYCDNDYRVASSAPKTGILGNCWQPCAGDSKEVCGGAGALSVYQSCEQGKPCTNSLFTMSGNSTSPVNNPPYSALPSSYSAPPASHSAPPASYSAPAHNSAPASYSAPPASYSAPPAHSSAAPPKSQSWVASSSAPAHYSAPPSHSAPAPPYSQPAASSSKPHHHHSSSKAQGYHSVKPTASSSSPASSSAVSPASSSSAVVSSSGSDLPTASSSSAAYPTKMSNSTMVAPTSSWLSPPAYHSVSAASVTESAVPTSSSGPQYSAPASSSAAPATSSEDCEETSSAAPASSTSTLMPSSVSSSAAPATTSDDCDEEESQKPKRHLHRRRSGHGHGHL